VVASFSTPVEAFASGRFALRFLLGAPKYAIAGHGRMRYRHAVMNRWLIALLSALAIFAANVGLIRHSIAAEQQTLEIASKTGVHIFSVEVAVTDEERARGLMYRKQLPEMQGMLFDFKREQEVSMWMQNTYIPLDMIFIRRDGRILRIAESTEPLSTTIIPSRGPALAVLEVIGGTARKLGLAPGDRVGAPMFAKH
jgi:uncharacterized protein